MSTPITLETVQKAWRVFSQVDQTLSTDDALEAGFIARNDEVADLVQERDAARAEVARLTVQLSEARRLIDMYPWATIAYGPGFANMCTACLSVDKGDRGHTAACPLAAFLAATTGATDAAT